MGFGLSGRSRADLRGTAHSPVSELTLSMGKTDRTKKPVALGTERG